MTLIKMNDLGICIVVKDNYYQTKYCIENLLFKTDTEVRLYIYDNGSKDIKVSEYLKNICEKNKWLYKYSEETLPLSKAYNKLIETVYQKYCCLFPVNTIVNKLWAEELISNYNQCSSPGILGINSDKDTKIQPILYDCEVEGDHFKNVWVTENGTIDGLVMFETSKIYEVGYFDEALNAPGLEIEEYSFRFLCKGLHNFYIPKQTCVKVNTQCNILFPEITHESIVNLKTEMNNMVKNQIFKK